MLLVVLCTLLLSAGQVLLKIGVESSPATPVSAALNAYLLAGLLLYVVAAFTITYALKHGELSVLHPIIALGFVWVTAASVLLLGETLTAGRVVGVAAIIAGVSLIGHGGSR